MMRYLFYKQLAVPKSKWCVEDVNIDALLPQDIAKSFIKTGLSACYCSNGDRQLRLSFLCHLLKDIVKERPDRSKVLRIGSFGAGFLAMEAVLGQALRLLGYTRVVLSAVDFDYRERKLPSGHSEIFELAWGQRRKYIELNSTGKIFTAVFNFFKSEFDAFKSPKSQDCALQLSHYFLYRLALCAQVRILEDTYGFQKTCFYASSETLFKECDTLDYWISADVLGSRYKLVLDRVDFYKLFFNSDVRDKFERTRVFLMECNGNFKMMMGDGFKPHMGSFVYDFVNLDEVSSERD